MPTTDLLCTDLDGTLAGDAAALSAFKDFLGSLAQPPELVYVTGRHLDSALELIASDGLPWPSVLVTDIGVAIYDGLTLREDPRWHHRMQQQWDPEAIKAIAHTIPDLSLQQLPHTRRVSFTTARAASVQMLQGALDAQNLAYTLIHSADRYVDVLPAGSGKGAAVQYVIQEYFDQVDQVLIAGDSGNDTAMLALGYPAVVVGNGHPELDVLRHLPTVYQARHTHAAGIIEGWQHFYQPRFNSSAHRRPGVVDKYL